MILAQSSGAVKPPTKDKTKYKRTEKTSQLIRAYRRAKDLKAKAPAPWSVEGWSRDAYDLTDLGKAATGRTPLTEELLTQAVAEVQRTYTVTEEGDHLRFVGTGTGNWARVLLPTDGEQVIVMLGSQAPWPEEAFERAARTWRGGK